MTADRYKKVERNLYCRENFRDDVWFLISYYALFTNRTGHPRRFNLHTRDIAEARLHLANKLPEDRYQKVDFDKPKREREEKKRLDA